MEGTDAQRWTAPFKPQTVLLSRRTYVVQSGSGVTSEGWLYLGVIVAHPHTVNSSQPFKALDKIPSFS